MFTQIIKSTIYRHPPIIAILANLNMAFEHQPIFIHIRAKNLKDFIVKADVEPERNTPLM